LAKIVKNLENVMKTIEEFLDILALRLGDLYQCPLMYGGSAEGVEVLLHTYHSLWAEIFDRSDEFLQIWHAVAAEQNCGAASFPIHYARSHPQASEQEVVSYVLEQWHSVGLRLNIPIQIPDHSKTGPQKFSPGHHVRLITFNGTSTPPQPCANEAENYWKLVGSTGKVEEAPHTSSRVLIRFDVDVVSYGLYCHNPIPNTLLIEPSDLILCAHQSQGR
jgi:hypothetical protein